MEGIEGSGSVDEVFLQRSAHWFEAIGERHSTRSYEERPVEPELLGRMEDLCASFRPYDDCRVELVRHPRSDLFRGIVGSYGKVTGAPHVLVMIAAGGAEAQQHLGFCGEAAVLEATSLGLSTCWVAGFFKRRSVTALLELADGERVAAVSALGYRSEVEGPGDRTMKRLAGSHRRLPAASIAEDWEAEWPLWARSAVECARLSPSAVNRQPWRFRLHEGQLVIRKTLGDLPGVTKDLDCGIAMLHAQVGAMESGMRGEWVSWDEQGDLARFEVDDGFQRP